jgi:hypothetical protein
MLITPPPPPSRLIIGIDSETEKMQAGLLAPPLVCVSTAVRVGDNFQTELYNWREGLGLYRRVLAMPDALIVIHNAPFDFGVAANEDAELLFSIFDAYMEGRICNTITLQKLIDVAKGWRKFRRYGEHAVKTKYSLTDLMLMYYNEVIEKLDTWRKSYAFLRNIPVNQWPTSARKYAIDDSIYHVRVFEAQQRFIWQHFGGMLPNQLEQQRAAFVLYLMSMWGIRAEQSRVDYFIKHCEEEIKKMHEALLYCLHCGKQRKEHQFGMSCRQPMAVLTDGFENTGIFKDDGSRTMAEIRRRVVEACGRLKIAVPITKPSKKFLGGQVVTDKDTLEQTDDPYLHVLAEQMSFAKHLGQWGPVLRAAVQRPVCCRYDELAETGRTASSGSEGQEGTNIQNPPRRGDVRPAVVPRPGYVFVSTDADTIELRAHAQDCLELVGWSRLAEIFVEQARSKGPDPHEALAANIVGIDARELQARRKAGDQDMADARQFAKIPGYGFPGGLGAETFVGYAAGQLSREAFNKWFSPYREKAVEKAKHLRDIWFNTLPENREYFKVINLLVDREKGYGTVQQLMSKRIRGGVRFTAMANGYFQARVADAMKDVLWRLAMECYTGRETDVNGKLTGRRSILFGSRPVMFLHDEPILEHPENGTESERADRQQQIMVECLQKWMPDIPCFSSAVMMRRWQKGAEPLRVDGKLVPVKPEKIVVDGQTKVKWVQDFGEPTRVAA